jgi:O-6-methylguanine DNA methyltransferase
MRIRCRTEMPIRWRTIDTPVGPVVLASDEADWITVEFVALHASQPSGGEDPALLPDAAAWLAACLVEPVGPPPIPIPAATPFRRACWAACRDIPIGQTRTYTELAAMAGNPSAARAAGSAMRTNPMPLITPCHRVLAASGLGGYDGATCAESRNLRLKRELIEVERQIAGEAARNAPR